MLPIWNGNSFVAALNVSVTCTVNWLAPCRSPLGQIRGLLNYFCVTWSIKIAFTSIEIYRRRGLFSRFCGSRVALQAVFGILADGKSFDRMRKESLEPRKYVVKALYLTYNTFLNLVSCVVCKIVDYHSTPNIYRFRYSKIAYLGCIHFLPPSSLYVRASQTVFMTRIWE